MSKDVGSADHIEVSGSGAAATHGGVAAGAGGVAVGRDVYGPVVVAGAGAHVTVTVQGESLRDKELAYLDALLARYQYWRDHYTPLAGIAEVRAAVQDGPRLDLPMPFIPPGFEKLVEHGYGERFEVRRQPVGDLRAAVAEHHRILLLGEPGSGKTTTLWRLCYDYAVAARVDARQPLPLLIPLGGYTDAGPFDIYLGHYLDPLAPYLETYRASGRLILLLDGLNEMPLANYAERVGSIRAVLERWPEEQVVVTCRALDYVIKLEELQKVEVSPLDEERIRTFLHNYLGETAGERLFWAMAGGDEVRALWDTCRAAGETWAEFWATEMMPETVSKRTSWVQDRLWSRLREEPPALLVLGRNPYLLLMTAQVYVHSGEQLPANRARLFEAFVDTLLERERERHPGRWLPAEHQVDALAALAYAMQAEGRRGTTVERAWAVDLLHQASPGLDAERLLYLATSATLLDAGETKVRFYHQLLQEYFAARELGRRVAAGKPLADYWPGGHWWEPSGWEETVILLAGMEPDASELLAELSSSNPVVAARCLKEGAAQVDDGTRARIIESLIDSMTDVQLPAVARAQAGAALGRLGDPRPGVGLRPDGLPDIAWCYVPPGKFDMGSNVGLPGERVGEQPPHPADLDGYFISRYPVTNAQFQAFVNAGGYQEQAYWREAEEVGVWLQGLVKRRGDMKPRNRPFAFGEPFNLPNHPVAGVTWYEALAYCRWLNGRLREENVLPEGWTVHLPSEAEWEKAARGGLQVPDKPIIIPVGAPPEAALHPNPYPKRAYPWGNLADPNRANYEMCIRTTCAVGCFPHGASPYGAQDLSGNVWEWTRSLWGKDVDKPEYTYPYYPADERENLEAGDLVLRVLRGGGFSDHERDVRCGMRNANNPSWYRHRGFRCVVLPVPSGLRPQEVP